MKADGGMNIGIVTAYNDMLSAHAVYYRYPELMKVWAREVALSVGHSCCPFRAPTR